MRRRIVLAGGASVEGEDAEVLEAAQKEIHRLEALCISLQAANTEAKDAAIADPSTPIIQPPPDIVAPGDSEGGAP